LKNIVNSACFSANLAVNLYKKCQKARI